LKQPSGKYGNLLFSWVGVTGGVCDSNFTQADVNVSCLEMGFDTGFGYSNGELSGISLKYPMWLDHLQCMGNESNLFQCDLGEGRGVACPRATATAVFCYNEDHIPSTVKELFSVKELCSKPPF